MLEKKYGAAADESTWAENVNRDKKNWSLALNAGAVNFKKTWMLSDTHIMLDMSRINGEIIISLTYYDFVKQLYFMLLQMQAEEEKF
jgi:hypothetical protein